MLKKYSPPAKIAVITFITAIGGFAAETFGFEHVGFMRVLSDLFFSIHLQWARLFGGYHLITFDQFFYLLLLLGAILYVTSKHRETRLIRFVFSLIFLSRIVLLAVIIINVLGFPRPDLKTFGGIFFEIYIFLLPVGWLYISWRILKYFNMIKALDKTEYQYGELLATDFSTATLWQRFFHLIVDSAICFMLFYWIIESLMHVESVRNSLLKWQQVVGERPMILIVIVFFRLIYYLLGEGILGTTPAKLLTETRVIDEAGNKPGFGTIAGRTASRFVPFEALSFFGPVGWHDKWSATRVTPEVRTGAKGGLYFLVIPFSLFLMILFSYSQKSYQIYQRRQLNNEKAAKEKIELDDELKHISTDHFFTLSLKEEYSIEKIYLKVERINSDSILFVKVTPANTYNPSQLTLEGLYTQDKDVLPQFAFTREAIKKALRPEYEYTDNSKALIVNGRPYSVMKIETCFRPNIKSGNTNSYGKEFYIGLTNTGWKASLTNVKVIEGDVNITNRLPEKIYTRTVDDEGYQFSIRGTAGDGNSAFIINFTIADTLGWQQVYQVKDNGTEQGGRTLVRLK